MGVEVKLGFVSICNTREWIRSFAGLGLLRCSVAPILTVHRVRFRFSLGRALHITAFDDANV